MKAVRVTRGSKTEIHVLDESGAILYKAGGKRAERAQAVVVSTWERYGGDDPARVNVELRADVAAAQSLSALHGKGTIGVRSGGRTVQLPCAKALSSVVLLVSEVAV